MTTRTTWTKGLTVAAAVLTAASVFALGVGAGQARTALEPVQIQADAGKALAQQTETCIGSISTDSAQCQQAAQKAAEVKAAPAPAQTTVVTAPRRSDAEVMALIQQVIERNPGLLPKGADGKPYVLTDADKAEIAGMVRGDIPTPKDGAAGTNGKDAVVDYDKIVTAVLAQIPTPKDGKDGAAGAQGPKGDTGAQGPPPSNFTFDPYACLPGQKVTETYDPASNSYVASCG